MEQGRPLTTSAPVRASVPAVLLTVGVAGLSWAPTFTLPPLVLPVLGPLLAVLAVDHVTVGRRGAGVLRPVLAVVLGSAALLFLLTRPTGVTPSTVLDGVVSGWRLTLDSTLPARPDVAAFAFVPALVLVAGVLAMEWTRHEAGPVVALLPATAVLALGQLFRAASGPVAVAVAAGFGLAATAVLLSDHPRGRAAGRRSGPWGPVLVTVTVAGAAAIAAIAIPGQPTVSLQDGRSIGRTVTAPDPLDQIATLLAAGERVAFRARTDSPVDRWPLVVLDRFDGANWSTSARFRHLGTGLPAPEVSADLTLAHADIAAVDIDGPWLPSHARLRTAEGIAPLVDSGTGVLVRGEGPLDHYSLTWNDLRIDAHDLTASAIDPAPTGAVEVAGVPAGIADLARQAVGPNTAPTVQAALVLEKWMRDTYQVATGTDIPTGHSTAQLLHFLTESKRGTSEQFATSYALMARSVGIPVRVVVGFRDDGTTIVHDDDVLAWPEIAVSGVGWVPLDPTGGARNSSADRSGLSAATQAAREELPDPSQLSTQQPGGPPPAAEEPAGPRGILVWPAAVLLVAAVAVIPSAKRVRRALRRRGPTRDVVANAWLDTRDCMRDQGIHVPLGATVRDTIGTAGIRPDDLETLAHCIDIALWAGRDPDARLVGQAWHAAAAVRRSLSNGDIRRRIRSQFAISGLRRERAQPLGQLAPRSD